MAAGLQDLVDCVRLAQQTATLERVYELDGLARVKDLLVAPHGTLAASFAFTKLPEGRLGATVTVRATPELVCQRCLKGFEFNALGVGHIEFADAGRGTGKDASKGAGEAERAGSDREYYEMQGGLVSLSDLAEEELLLALPIAPACTTPQTCGNAPSFASGDVASDAAGGMRLPFGALQDLLKKT